MSGALGFDKYIQDLKERHNVHVIHQISRSPETNLLDLGVWYSLQSAVEKTHRFRRIDNVEALVQSCNETWENYDTTVFNKVFEHWKKVLRIIIADHGDNKLVDGHRKELFVLNIVMPRPNDVEDDAEAMASEDDEIDSW